ncbi:MULTISPECIES: hypothetical protein [unclassified Variovorax]|jgi:hypothetical protein|uniref:hypothetical protein n=1 Tax=unclassified Variovorax TaxID=663243 RepID=UPI000F7D7AD4|nr:MULTISPECIES: hypothetical protein [unclassified Variovorax]RSZ43977.1 hypothetical protein EJO70_08545 [Variovorax sp. 553]RSZ45369.1 hypothetical protein EJO71_09300 [Variovorax sp. 679]
MFITRSSDSGSATKPSSARVARALEIHRSVAACNAHIARGSDSTHALTAALMLPCYKTEFRNLVLALTSDEERELRYALDALCDCAA